MGSVVAKLPLLEGVFIAFLIGWLECRNCWGLSSYADASSSGAWRQIGVAWILSAAVVVLTCTGRGSAGALGKTGALPRFAKWAVFDTHG
jgi:hypothetical protein